MRFAIILSISFIAGNYALSPPLADIGMKPDYALGDDLVEPIELEMGGDYVNMDIGSNQHEKGFEENHLMEEHESQESSIYEEEEIYQLNFDFHHHHSFSHPHNGGHYTLPVESNPTI